jgi:putative inorganic carbon (hco3(-)) transporter
MSTFLFHFGQDNDESPASQQLPLRTRLKQEFVLAKMNTPLGFALLVGLAMAAATTIGANGWEAAVLLMFVVLILPVMLVAVFHVRFGLYLMLGTSFFVAAMKRLVPELPFAVLLDLLLICMLFGVFLQQVHRRDWRFAQSPLTIGVLIWLGYNIFQLVNPWLPSLQAWLYTVRGTVGYMLFYFAALYGLKRWRQVRALVNFWLVLATIAALYGLFQEVFGLREFEENWAFSRLVYLQNLSLGDSFRKFSFFADPATFGLVMAVSSMLGLGLLFERHQSSTRRLLLILASTLMIVAMFFSGTRTAFVILPVGYGAIMLLTLRRDLWLMGLGGAVIWLVLIFAPVSHPTLQRLQEAFRPSTAMSFQSRLENQDFAQPLIQRHTIGVGLGTTGERGQIFSPHTLLSQYPSDSGYVLIGIETGWLGLFLFMGLLLLALVTGSRNYFRTQGEDRRLYVAIFTGMMLALVVANYPQKALFLPPLNFMFFLAMALVVKVQQLAPAPRKVPGQA